ncbi:MAG TPA: phosphate acetyltransferase [Dissulfurispiraceae bacterium]|nr:phosphate acetyltransferase [Dissulfurispiraceae bacterium]
MAQGIYVASAEPRTDKAIVVLGMMELLWHQSQKIGFFRPIIRDEVDRDPLIHLIKSRYNLKFTYDDMYGYTHDIARDMLAADRYDEFQKLVIEKYKKLEDRCDIVLIAGTDFTGVSTPLEFDFNIDVANNLNCLVVPVAKGFGRNLIEISEAVTSIVESLEKRKCSILSVIVNRVAPDLVVDAPIRLKNTVPTGIPIYAIAENAMLWKPTICEIAKAIDAQFLSGQENCFNREVTDYKVAAMRLANFLDHIQEGTVVIAPGDRDDITVGTIMADISTTYPRVGGLILSGGFKPSRQIQKLIDGFAKDVVPILSVDTDTFTTAVDVSKVEGMLQPENTRKVETALGLFEAGINVPELKERLSVTKSVRVTPLMFEYSLIQRAKANKQHIVLPEGEEPRILRAAELLMLRQVCDITLLGNPDKIRAKIAELGLKIEKVSIIDPSASDLRKEYAEAYYELRKHKGVTKEAAFDIMSDGSYFGTMMVFKGQADGMVSGSINTTQHTIRPSLEFVKTKPGVNIVSSVFIMCLSDRVLVFGDCAVNPNPDEKQLADIAISSADTAAAFGIEPRVAMLSYSTGESGKGKDVDKVKEATKLAKAARPDLKIEGPLQFDAAIDPEVAKVKLPTSDVAGKATVFIFPDLNTGNNTYKAVQRSANAVAVGPVMQGLNKPVNDLSRGCTVADILNTVAITAVQAQFDKKA